MSHEERLERMRESGVISEEQFTSLQNSLDKSIALEEKEYKRKCIPMWVGILVALVNLGIALMFVDFGGDVPVVQPEMTNAVEDVSKTLNQGVVGTMDSKISNTLSSIIFAAFILLPIIMFIMLHNGLVEDEEQVHVAWAQVESNYQRRADLIPNLVETVSKYIDHEAETLDNVTKARAGIDDTISGLIETQKEAAAMLKETKGQAPEDEAFLETLNTTQANIGRAMSKIIATVESYPDLKGSEQIMQLQAQLEGSENRINVSRMRFNEVVGEFNGGVRKMPTSLVASIGNFRRKAYFKSDVGAEKVKEVSFE